MTIKRFAALAVLGLALAAPRVHAQPAGDKPAPGPTAPPSDADMQKAKKAFGEGKKLFDAKKYAEAVDKFKESYRLSKNPVLLYNVGVTLDQKGDRDLALFYYKKFLTDAPADAAQRGEVTARVKELEATKPTVDTSAGSGSGSGSEPGSASGSASGSDTGSASGSDTGSGSGSASGSDSASGSSSGSDTEPPPDTHPHVKHPKGAAYTATDFEHVVVDSAPPGKPLDLTAYAPDDAGWQVTMYYRGSGDAKFTAVPMKLRYHELVARIPGSRMNGESVQYYLEVKDHEGAVVTRLGRASSPNLVYLEADAKPRFYPDLDDADGTAAAALRDEHTSTGDEHHDAETPDVGGGYFDVGSTNFERAKWATTGTAAGLVTLSLVFYLVSSSAASSLEGDAARSQTDCGTPPCSTYDADLKTIDSRGKGFETMTNVAFFLGLTAAAGAGYFWYEEHEHPGKEHATARTTPRSFVATPVVGDGFLGGAAVVRF